MMPSDEPPQKSIKPSLKRYIMRERQRERQEQEAGAEVIRRKKELDQKKKLDNDRNKTLRDHSEQLAECQAKLATLTETKHQLFLSLKKVLNEDDNRRRQAVVRETHSDMMQAMPSTQSYPPMGTVSGPLFLQPIQRLPVYKTAPSTSGTAGPVTVQGAAAMGMSSSKNANKRPRSPPSPPHGYHPYNNYKTPSFASSPVQPQHSKPPSQQEQAPPQLHPQHQRPSHGPADDVRRNHEFTRAVLWNKGTAPPYVNVYGNVYGMAPSPPVYSYANAPPGPAYEQVYTSRQPYDGKADGEKVFVRGPAGPLPMSVHPASAPKAALNTPFNIRPSHQHNAYLTPSSSSGARLIYTGHSPASVQPPAARYQSSGAM